MKGAESNKHVITLLKELRTAEGLTIRNIKTDNAIVTKVLKEYCADEGIRLTPSAPHRH